MDPTGEALLRYERFGWDYELHSPLTETEVAWYQGFAARAGGPVLELACGTGRLLCRLADAGAAVTGLDISTGMLSRARRRLRGLPPAVARRAQLLRADMCAFRLRRRFGLVLIADNSFRELATPADQGACLRCVVDHLADGGTLLLTARRASTVRYNRDLPWSEPRVDPATGARVTRRISTRLQDGGTRVAGSMRYRVEHADGRTEEVECPFAAPVMATRDYLERLGEAGLTARVCVGYEERQDDGEAPILCFVASRREA